MKGTKEFYDLQAQFEKDVPKATYGHRFDRVERGSNVPANVFYNDGHVNELFTAYMLAYQFGKTVARLE